MPSRALVVPPHPPCSSPRVVVPRSDIYEEVAHHPSRHREAEPEVRRRVRQVEAWRRERESVVGLARGLNVNVRIGREIAQPEVVVRVRHLVRTRQPRAGAALPVIPSEAIVVAVRPSIAQSETVEGAPTEACVWHRNRFVPSAQPHHHCSECQCHPCTDYANSGGTNPPSTTPDSHTSQRWPAASALPIATNRGRR